jgi:hypothetical protein
VFEHFQNAVPPSTVVYKPPHAPSTFQITIGVVKGKVKKPKIVVGIIVKTPRTIPIIIAYPVH